MSKRIRNKTAKFELEPDGFSIHTFELWQQLTHAEYQAIREFLYSKNKSGKKVCTYPNDWQNIVSSAFSDHGVGITLEDSDGRDNKHRLYGIRIFVSPRRLIDPGTSYLGILPPSKEFVDKLAKKFQKLLKSTPIPKDIDNYTVTRVDLCTNIRCSYLKLCRELVRVIRKLPTPPKYERKFRKRDTDGLSKEKRKAIRKEDNEYNKHYFKVSCGSRDLVIYDKGYQITAEGLEEIGYEKLSNGVLRFECRYKRDILRDIEKDNDIGSCTDLLKFLISNSEPLLTGAFSMYFAEEPFCRFDEIERQIEDSAYRSDTRELMVEFSERLRRGQIMDNVFKRMKKDGWKFDRKELLDRFQELGINPIPLWENFCAEQLPSPIALLKGISDGKIKVDYVVIK